MDMLNFILQVVSALIALTVFFLIKNLFPSYFSEKGKNLATKEDIEEITEKIKSVESKINIKTSTEIDYHILKRKTIIEYFAALNYWQNIIYDSHADHSNDNEIINKNLIEKIKEAERKYNLKQGEVDLFIFDNEFYKLRHSLVMKILNVRIEFEKHCETIRYIVLTNKTDTHNKIMEKEEEYSDISIKELEEIMLIRKKLINYLSNIIRE